MKCIASVGLLLLHLVFANTSLELVTKASNEFSNKIYQELAKKQGNVLVCPFSAHLALTLVHQGAGGNTARELATALSLTGDNAVIKENYKSLISGIKGNVLKVATKLFSSAGHQINEDYINLAKNYFLSDVETTNFSNPTAAANSINKYVEEKTNNTIHNLISPSFLSAMTRLVVINAVHFQSEWESPFPKANEGIFKVTSKTNTSCQMMTQTATFLYKEDAVLGAKVLKMDYKDKGYSMLYILPTNEDGLAVLESKMANSNLESILKDLTPQLIRVTIPKFKLENSINLKTGLINMGVRDLFSSAANLSQISTMDDLYVSEAVQKTYMIVDEGGTEAAGATGIILDVRTSHEFVYKAIFNADHPFIFKLIHNNFILFEGRLVDVNVM